MLLRPAAPQASIILMPGGDGHIAAGPDGAIGKLKGNQLVRTRNAYLARALAVLVVDADVNLKRHEITLNRFWIPKSVGF